MVRFHSSRNIGAMPQQYRNGLCNAIAVDMLLVRCHSIRNIGGTMPQQYRYWWCNVIAVGMLMVQCNSNRDVGGAMSQQSRY